MTGRKVIQYLTVAMLFAGFGAAGLVGTIHAVLDVPSWKPKLNMYSATTHLLPHLFLLLAWPAFFIFASKTKCAWSGKGTAYTQGDHCDENIDDPEQPIVGRRK